MTITMVEKINNELTRKIVVNIDVTAKASIP